MKNKYRNIKTTVDGIKFDSKGEAKRWFELRLREKAGEILSLDRQVTYHLTCNNKPICKYIADFVYSENGVTIVEDFKSSASMTDAFRIKAKLFEANFGFPIRISKK